MNFSFPGCLKTLRKAGATLPVLGLLGVMLSAPREARASSGPFFFETIGISTAVGAVLGASTLPFYDQPGKHLMNTAYGASIGAVAGLGIFIYGVANRTVDDRLNFGERDHRDPSSPVQTTHHDFGSGMLPVSASMAASPGDHLPFFARVALNRASALFWMPVVSLTW